MNPRVVRVLVRTMFHALGACLSPYNAFLRRSLWPGAIVLPRGGSHHTVSSRGALSKAVLISKCVIGLVDLSATLSCWERLARHSVAVSLTNDAI